MDNSKIIVMDQLNLDNVSLIFDKNITITYDSYPNGQLSGLNSIQVKKGTLTLYIPVVKSRHTVNSFLTIDGGNVILEKHAVLSGKILTSGPAGVIYLKSGSLNMKDGQIRMNMTNGLSSPIYISGGSFTSSGGRITDN